MHLVMNGAIGHIAPLRLATEVGLVQVRQTQVCPAQIDPPDWFHSVWLHSQVGHSNAT